MPQNILSVTGILIAAAITPGPNNFIALDAGARGVRVAGHAIAAILFGSLIILVLTSLGLQNALRVEPKFGLAIAVLGGGYLAWLGARMMGAAKAWQSYPSTALPQSFLGIATFQLLNPKAWALVTTVAAPMADDSNLPVLVALLVGTTSICLMLWAAAGARFHAVLEHPTARRRFDLAMGSLLIVSASAMVVEALA